MTTKKTLWIGAAAVAATLAAVYLLNKRGALDRVRNDANGPRLPGMPAMPKMPEMPKMPSMPAMPKMPKMPGWGPI